MGQINPRCRMPSAVFSKTRKCRSKRLPGKKLLSGGGRTYGGIQGHSEKGEAGIKSSSIQPPCRGGCECHLGRPAFSSCRSRIDAALSAERNQPDPPRQIQLSFKFCIEPRRLPEPVNHPPCAVGSTLRPSHLAIVLCNHLFQLFDNCRVAPLEFVLERLLGSFIRVEDVVRKTAAFRRFGKNALGLPAMTQAQPPQVPNRPQIPVGAGLSAKTSARPKTLPSLVRPM